MGPGKTLDQALAALFVRAFEDNGYFWAACRFCPRRQLCNPKYGPAICPFCKVALVAERPPAAVN